MKSIKVKPGETFELIITDDKGEEMVKQCFYFDITTAISTKVRGGFLNEIDMRPAFDVTKIEQSEEFVSEKCIFDSEIMD